MDLTGVDELQVLKEELTRRNIKLALMRVHRPVHQLLSRSGFLDSVVFDNLSDYKGEAISKLFSLIDHGYCRNDCPYRLFDECDTVKQALG
jgi:SulP family sulfate permease